MTGLQPPPGPPVRFRGVPAERHATLGSTNDEAFRRCAEGAPEGLVVTAETQTAGRGRQGRAWWDAPGASLLFSVLLRPRLPLPAFPLLGLAMASAVADAGEAAAGAPLAVKWPNDVVHGGRKVCGVLAEARSRAPGERPVLVIGAGVNVNQGGAEFPEEVASAATSLRLAAGGRSIDRDGLLRDVLERFEALLDPAGADPAALLGALRARLPRPGSPIRILQGERIVQGVVESVLETGALRVRDSRSGRVETVAAGVEA